MKQVNVGILGATGAVGQEMIKILEERNFPVASLRPIASARSAGSKIMFRGQECTIVEASDDAFEGLDIVLGAAENDIAERFAPSIVKAGAVFVDNSSAFRMDADVPLVVPEVNPEDALDAPRRVIANPNCSTIQLVVALKAIENISHIRRVYVSTYQAASGAGAGAMAELEGQYADMAAGRPPRGAGIAPRAACRLRRRARVWPWLNQCPAPEIRFFPSWISLHCWRARR